MLSFLTLVCWEWISEYSCGKRFPPVSCFGDTMAIPLSGLLRHQIKHIVTRKDAMPCLLSETKRFCTIPNTAHQAATHAHSRWWRHCCTTQLLFIAHLYVCFSQSQRSLIFIVSWRAPLRPSRLENPRNSNSRVRCDVAVLPNGLAFTSEIKRPSG